MTEQPQPDQPQDYTWQHVRNDYQNWHEGLQPHVERLLGERALGVPSASGALVVGEVVTAAEELPNLSDGYNALDDRTYGQATAEEMSALLDPYVDENDAVKPDAAKHILETSKSWVGYGTYWLLGEALADKPSLLTGIVDFVKEEGSDWDQAAARSLLDIASQAASTSDSEESMGTVKYLTQELPKPVEVDSASDFYTNYAKFGHQDVSVAEAATYSIFVPVSYKGTLQTIPTAENIRFVANSADSVCEATRELMQYKVYEPDELIRIDKYIALLDPEKAKSNAAQNVADVARTLNIDKGSEAVRQSTEFMDKLLDHGHDIHRITEAFGSGYLFKLYAKAEATREADSEIFNAVDIILGRKDFFEIADQKTLLSTLGMPLELSERKVRESMSKFIRIGERIDEVVDAGYPRQRFMQQLAKRNFVNIDFSQCDYIINAMKSLGNSTDEMLTLLGMGSDPFINEYLKPSEGVNEVFAQDVRADLAELTAKVKDIVTTHPDGALLLKNLFTGTLALRREEGSMSVANIQAKISLCDQLGEPGQFIPTILTSATVFDLARRANDLTQEHQKEIADFALAKGDVMAVLSVYGTSRQIDSPGAFLDLGLEQAIADQALEQGAVLILQDRIENGYHFTPEQIAAVENIYIQGEDVEDYAKYIKEVLRLPIADRPQVSGTAIELFGEYISVEGAALIKSIVDNEPTAEWKEIGIANSGERGLQQLEDTIKSFTLELQQINLSEEALLRVERSVTLRNVFMQLTRYDKSEWGSHDDTALKEKLAYFRTALEDGRITALGEAYQPSGVVEITKLKALKHKPQWTEDLLQRYGILAQDLRDVNEHLREGNRRPFTDLLTELSGKIADIAEAMGEKLDSGTISQKGRAAIEAKRQDLLALITAYSDDKPGRYPLRSLADFERNFSVLAKHDELHPVMRQLVFAWALRKNPDWSSRLEALQEQPDVEDISTAREFIEHIVNQETFKQYFTDKQSARMFGAMTSTRALDDALMRLQGRGVSKNTTPVQFVPTRGIMAELSGYIADACWADKYASLAEEMPNMTTVIFKQFPGEPHKEKLIGAGMLIETYSETDGRLLVIRGLNPLETFINSVSVESFYDQFVGYARGVAEKQERKLAIVIDNYAGGSASNRQVLFGYLAGKRGSLKKAKVDKMDTTFNGYDISNDTYLL